jgi:hypothetical protein
MEDLDHLVVYAGDETGTGCIVVFFVNLPIGILAAVLAPRLLAESRDEDRTRSYDVLGALTVTAGLVLLVYAMVNTDQYGWGSVQTIGELIGSAVLLLAFVTIEARFAAHPLMPLRIFRSQTLSGANVVALLVGLTLFALCRTPWSPALPEDLEWPPPSLWPLPSWPR